MSKESVVTLDANSGIAHAEQLGNTLEDKLGEGNPVVIDASEVERIDTSIAQLIYSFSVSMKSAGIPLTIRGRSQAFNDGLVQLGLASFIDKEGAN